MSILLDISPYYTLHEHLLPKPSTKTLVPCDSDWHNDGEQYNPTHRKGIITVHQALPGAHKLLEVMSQRQGRVLKIIVDMGRVLHTTAWCCVTQLYIPYMP